MGVEIDGYRYQFLTEAECKPLFFFSGFSHQPGQPAAATNTPLEAPGDGGVMEVDSVFFIKATCIPVYDFVVN